MNIPWYVHGKEDFAKFEPVFNKIRRESSN